MKKDNPIPPKRPLKFLRWFCREDYLEEIEGDLTEVFKKEFEESPRKAKWKFTWRTIRYFRPEFMKSFKNQYPSNPYGMYKSYFKIAFRSLLKRKSYTVLNAFGLSVGFACFILIGLWVMDELSYDQFHEKSDRLYRVAAYFTDESGKYDQAVTCIPLAPALKNDLPEIEDALRIDPNGAVVKFSDKQFIEEDLLAVDPSFFNMLSLKLLKGNPATALIEPYSIVLSETMARKYFGDKDPLGESLTIFQYDPSGMGAEYKITGVIEDCPRNSHFHYNFLFSFKTVEVADPGSFGYDGWFNNSYYNYVLLKEGTNKEVLAKRLETFLDKYIGQDMKKYKVYWSYFLQPVSDIHLLSHLRYEIKPTSSITNIFVFGAIGLIVLLLACINYINLSIAYAGNRLREMGVRKVVGAFKSQLMLQHLVESCVLSLLALAVAFLWIQLSRPMFESLTGKPLLNLYTWNTLCILIGAAIVVGLLSGVYPSFVMTSFRTVQVLKGYFKTGASGIWLRKSLIVVQFSITMVLVAAIFLVQLQFRFINNKDLGFNKSNLLVMNVNGSNEVKKGFNTFANELSANPKVSSVARSNSFISNGLSNRTVTLTDAEDKKVVGTLYTIGIDQEYINAYGMTLIAGRNFLGDNPSDSTRLIVNEMTARNYGYKNAGDIVGKEIEFDPSRKFEVIGVVKDFHSNSLHQRVEPTAMYLLSTDNFSRIAVRLHREDQESLQDMSTLWKKHFPNSVFDASFAEDRLQSQYISEERFAKIFFSFSLISLAIACLGLFSLVSYSVEARVKEIGIRKVLGASVKSIIRLVVREFLVLILIACVIATPVAWYFLNEWLATFAYRVDLNAVIFIWAIGIVMLIAWTTVTARTLLAAIANPVESLRSE